MSFLQKAFAKAKLSSYPAIMSTAAPFLEADEKEETDHFDVESAELHYDNASSAASFASFASSTGTIIPFLKNHVGKWN